MEDNLSKDYLKSFEKAVYNGQGKAFTLLENFSTLFPENEKSKDLIATAQKQYFLNCKETLKTFLSNPSPYFHAPCHNHYYNDLLNSLNFTLEELEKMLVGDISVNGVKIIMFNLVLKANSNDIKAVTIINNYLQQGVHFNEILPQLCAEATFNLDENIICDRLLQEDALLDANLKANKNSFTRGEKTSSVLKFDDNSEAAKYFLNKEPSVCLNWARKFITCSSERKNLAEALIIEHGTFKDKEILHNLLQKFTVNENWENVSDILTKFESLNEPLPGTLLLNFWNQSPYFYVRLKAFQLMKLSCKKEVAFEGLKDADMLVREECTKFL